jgi:hypothetical protein
MNEMEQLLIYPIVSLREINKDIVYTFTGIGIFRFFSLPTHFAFIFFAVWNVSLACEQSENTHIFSLQSENEDHHILTYFRFKRI